MGKHSTVLTSLLLVLLPTSARAQDETAKPEGTGLTRLGLSPGEPQTRSAPPQIPLGIPPSQSTSNTFDFHGFLLLPLNIGVLKREDPGPDQRANALHLPPQIPQYMRSFGWTGVVPDPWAQMNFSYGNSTINGTVIVGARSFTDAAGYFNPVEQLGVTDAYIATDLSKVLDIPVELKVGAVTGRYGPMGAYDAGKYGTPLLARTNSIGELLTAYWDMGDFNLVLEQGAGGQLGQPARGIVPAGWNDYADDTVGASFVYHFHAGLGFKKFAQLGLHYFGALSADDRATGGETVPDGHINQFGADLRLTAGRGGHFYFGAAYTDLTDAAVVSGVLEILNARGGPEIMREYLGQASGGNGSLMVLGGQYDLSIARLVYGNVYRGRSPDLRLSLFGVATMVSSEEDAYDGVTKLKAGGDLTYSMAKWLGVGARFDHVRPNSAINTQSYHIISPRILLHTDWEAREELMLQYSRFIYGEDVIVRTGYPPEDDPSAVPDENVFVLSGTYWW